MKDIINNSMNIGSDGDFFNAVPTHIQNIINQLIVANPTSSLSGTSSTPEGQANLEAAKKLIQSGELQLTPEAKTIIDAGLSPITEYPKEITPLGSPGVLSNVPVNNNVIIPTRNSTTTTNPVDTNTASTTAISKVSLTTILVIGGVALATIATLFILKKKKII
jgi:hypothetical protein